MREGGGRAGPITRGFLRLGLESGGGRSVTAGDPVSVGDEGVRFLPAGREEGLLGGERGVPDSLDSEAFLDFCSSEGDATGGGLNVLNKKRSYIRLQWNLR